MNEIGGYTKPPLPVIATHRTLAVFHASVGVLFLVSSLFSLIRGIGYLAIFFIGISLFYLVQAYGFWKLQRWAAALFAANLADLLMIPGLFAALIPVGLGFALWLFIKVALLVFIYMNRGFLEGKYFQPIPALFFAIFFLTILFTLIFVRVTLRQI